MACTKIARSVTGSQTERRSEDMVAFEIFKVVRRVHSKLSTLDFRRTDFGRLKGSVW